MFLIRLIYASELSEGFGLKHIQAIFEKARRYNENNYITGLLYFNSQYALQCLEGPRETVNNTFQRIAKDPLHHNIQILSVEDITVRDFALWHMGYIPESGLTGSMLLKYSGSREFNPYELTGVACHQMMLDVKDTVPLQ